MPTVWVGWFIKFRGIIKCHFKIHNYRYFRMIHRAMFLVENPNQFNLNFY